MSDIKFGPLSIAPSALGSQGNAVLGIRDSGKTYTATWFAERLFEAGVPFVTFDPTGVWRFLRVPGRGKGYPVVVAGGKAGDLPLNPASAPKIVEAAMQSGVSLVIDLFDANLTKADWRRIVKDSVTVLMHKNHEYGLRHIFLEEAAEFVPQKVLDGDVYSVIERLARMGGNFRLGYTLINQRSQEVNKAVLELCENVFLHRQKGKNSLENLKKWLELATDKEVDTVMSSISTLPTGQCWAWLGGAEHPTLVKVPAKNSFHPDRRVMHGDSGVRVAAAIDVGKFVETLKGVLPAIQAEADAKDPAKLKARIAELEKQLRAASSNQGGKISTADETQIRSEGYNAGWAAALKETRKAHQVTVKGFDQLRAALTKIGSMAAAAIEQIPVSPPEPAVSPVPAPAVPAPRAPIAATRTRATPSTQPAEGLTRSQQRVLDALAWWAALGFDAPTAVQVASAARYSIGGNFNNLCSSLTSSGHVERRTPGSLSLTAAGQAAATHPEAPGSTEALHDMVIATLKAPQQKVFAALVKAYPEALSAERLAEDSGYSVGGNFNNLVSSLSAREILERPRPGMVRAADWLFVE